MSTITQTLTKSGKVKLRQTVDPEVAKRLQANKRHKASQAKKAANPRLSTQTISGAVPTRDQIRAALTYVNGLSTSVIPQVLSYVVAVETSLAAIAVTRAKKDSSTNIVEEVDLHPGS